MGRQLAQPVVNAVVLRVAGRLETLLWRRPEGERWSLPGGLVRAHEALDAATRRHLLEKVGVVAVAHLEQLGTASTAAPGAEWMIDVGHVALIPRGAEPTLPPDTEWHPVQALPAIAFGHAAMIALAHERLRGKLSYSNVAFALVPERFTVRELAGVYAAVLGHPVDPTNLRRVLERDGLLVATGARRPSGGRPAAEFAFADRALVVSRPFAAFRPPARTGSA